MPKVVIDSDEEEAPPRAAPTPSKTPRRKAPSSDEPPLSLVEYEPSTQSMPQDLRRLLAAQHAQFWLPSVEVFLEYEIDGRPAFAHHRTYHSDAELLSRQALYRARRVHIVNGVGGVPAHGAETVQRADCFDATAAPGVVFLSPHDLAAPLVLDCGEQGLAPIWPGGEASRLELEYLTTMPLPADGGAQVTCRGGRGVSVVGPTTLLLEGEVKAGTQLEVWIEDEWRSTSVRGRARASRQSSRADDAAAMVSARRMRAGAELRLDAFKNKGIDEAIREGLPEMRVRVGPGWLAAPLRVVPPRRLCGLEGEDRGAMRVWEAPELRFLQPVEDEQGRAYRWHAPLVAYAGEARGGDVLFDDPLMPHGPLLVGALDLDPHGPEHLRRELVDFGVAACLMLAGAAGRRVVAVRTGGKGAHVHAAPVEPEGEPRRVRVRAEDNQLMLSEWPPGCASRGLCFALHDAPLFRGIRDAPLPARRRADGWWNVGWSEVPSLPPCAATLHLLRKRAPVLRTVMDEAETDMGRARLCAAWACMSGKARAAHPSAKAALYRLIDRGALAASHGVAHARADKAMRFARFESEAKGLGAMLRDGGGWTTQEWRERAGPAAAFLKSREAAPPENLKDVAALRAWAPYAFRAAAARAEAPPVEECLRD